MARHKRQPCRMAASTRRERHTWDETATTEPAPPPSSPPDRNAQRLHELFHALPRELREEIFACLVVRPVKWDAKHLPDCPKLATPPLHYTDSIRPGPNLWYDGCARACATAAPGRADVANWLGSQPVWIDPWRSRWAPAITNPYVCSRCFDARLRPGRGEAEAEAEAGAEEPSVPRPRPPPSPSLGLPCLCWRRARDLQALLVCRQWYEEAAGVLYARSVLAFAAPSELVDFLEGLAPRWARLVTSVSLRLLPAEPDGGDAVGPPDTAEEELRLASRRPATDLFAGPRGLARAWTLLGHRLPALAALELDALFLTRPEAVAVFRRPGPPSRPRVRFTQSRRPLVDAREPRRDDTPRRAAWEARLRDVQACVWPATHYRLLVSEASDEAGDTAFARDVARGIEGRRRGWRKKHCRHDGREVLRERDRYVRRFMLPGAAGDGGTLHGNADGNGTTS